MLVSDSLVRQFVEAVNAVLAALCGDTFLAQAPTRILLLFGPSPLRPLEAYDIRRACCYGVACGVALWTLFHSLIPALHGPRGVLPSAVSGGWKT